MVCVPCFMIPFLLLVWRFIQPFILMLWNPPEKEPAPGEQENPNEVKDYCPSALLCPCNKKNTSECKPEIKADDVKKDD